MKENEKKKGRYNLFYVFSENIEKIQLPSSVYNDILDSILKSAKRLTVSKESDKDG